MLTGPLFMLQVYDRVLASRSVSTLVALTLLVADLFTFKVICGFPPRRKSVWCSFMLLCTPSGPMALDVP